MVPLFLEQVLLVAVFSMLIVAGLLQGLYTWIKWFALDLFIRQSRDDVDQSEL